MSSCPSEEIVGKYLVHTPAFALFVALVSGCTSSYLYTPTIAQRSLHSNIVLDNADTGQPRASGFRITDADVFAFANDVKQAWRYRSQTSRGFGVLTGVSRVGLSAAATTVAGTAGLEQSGDTIPILTGIATFIGELFGLVDPGGRAEAYQDGLRLILDAEAEYLQGLAKLKKSAASGTELTEPGAVLFRRVNASIAVVDKALQGRVPTQEEIEAATARVVKKESEKPTDKGASPTGGSTSTPTGTSATATPK